MPIECTVECGRRVNVQRGDEKLGRSVELLAEEDGVANKLVLLLLRDARLHGQREHLGERRPRGELGHHRHGGERWTRREVSL